MFNVSRLFKGRAKKRADKGKQRAGKMLALAKELLEPDERIVYCFTGQAGVSPAYNRNNPDANQTAGLNQFLVIAITNRNIVLLHARSFTTHPTKVFARLPLQTRLGPVNHRASWSHINCEAAFARDIKIWVPSNAYRLVDAHDRSLSSTPPAT